MARSILAGLATLAAVMTMAAPAGAGTLETPIDPRQQTALEFGDRSHWLQPWRGYLDTVPAQRLQDAVGINFNVEPGYADATARLLSESGFRRARVEIGWGKIDFAHQDRLWNDDSIRTTLTALRDHGLRPLILLNAHHGAPAPCRFFDARITQPAPQGATTIRVDAATAQAIQPGRTGLNAVDDYKAAAILFTAVLPDGTVTLSRPLPAGISAGVHPATTLAYKPFERPRLSNGDPNPDFEESMAGWLSYVDVVTRRVREIMGGTEFDVEVWNELTFGSDFLDASRYYDPVPQIGAGDTEREVLERTIEFIRDPARGLGGVGIGDGFANQRPWEAGSNSPPGLTAIDRHPYRGMVRMPDDVRDSGIRPLDASGAPNGTQLGPDTWHEDFVPRYNAFFPEYFLSAIQTEHMVRDLSPITTSVYGTPHGRNTHPPGSPPPEVWITETGLDFSEVEASAGLGPADVEHLRVKSTLRSTTAFVNKGVTALHFYAARSAGFGLVDGSFFEQVDQRGGAFPGPATGGPAMAAMGRMMAGFEPGQLEHERDLSLLQVSDQHDQRQFEGGAGRPPLYNRDVLAFLPFQTSDSQFVASVYVMTRDMVRINRPELASNNPARFDLPPATYRMTIGNVSGDDVRVSAYDPLLDQQVPVQVVSRSADRAVVELPVTDSPRLLTLEDSGTAGRAEDPPGGGGQTAPPIGPAVSSPAGGAPSPPAVEPAGPSVEVGSVKIVRRSLVISGRATRSLGVRLTAELYGAGGRHLVRHRIRAGEGPFRVKLPLPRSLTVDQSVRGVRVQAQTPEGTHRSRWPL